jgi:hypothetical protein
MIRFFGHPEHSNGREYVLDLSLVSCRPRLAEARLALYALLLSMLFLFSCAPRRPLVASIPWTDGAGAALAFRDEAPRAAGREGHFSSDTPADRYILDKPYTVGAGIALDLELLRPGAQVQALDAVLEGRKDGRGFKSESAVALRDEDTHWVIPLERGEILSSIRLRLASPSRAADKIAADGSKPKAPAADAFVLASLSFRPMFRGFEKISRGVRVSTGFSFYVSGGEQHVTIEHPFDDLDSIHDKGGAGIVLDYGRCAASAPFEIFPAASSQGKLYLRPRLSGLRTVLGASLFPSAAQRVEFVFPAGVDLRSLYSAYVADPEAELADLGRVLLSPPGNPAADFDLYRWDRFPSVLVFDFRDYAAQDCYLKRMAYFTEKIGYRGTLLTDAQMADMHGWNAHDYRPQDLAVFFQTARKKGFALDKEELALRDILLSHGVIVDKDGTFSPGQGAIISISRESPSYLRTQFIVHESTHAIFFVDPDYRKFVRALWATIQPDERWFWFVFFKWAGYDIGSEYLMANEFQAYLLQQPVARAEEYFSKTQAAEILKKHPEYKDKIDEYMKRFSSRYPEHAAAIEAWLEKKYGLGAGKTYSLY